MTIKHAPRGSADLEALVASDPDFVLVLMRTALQEVLEAAMIGTVGPAKVERTDDQLDYGLDVMAGRWSCGSAGWSSGVESDALSRAREGRFSTELVDRYRRFARALVAAPAEMCRSRQHCR